MLPVIIILIDSFNVTRFGELPSTPTEAPTSPGGPSSPTEMPVPTEVPSPTSTVTTISLTSPAGRVDDRRGHLVIELRLLDSSGVCVYERWRWIE